MQEVPLTRDQIAAKKEAIAQRRAETARETPYKIYADLPEFARKMVDEYIAAINAALNGGSLTPEQVAEYQKLALHAGNAAAASVAGKGRHWGYFDDQVKALRRFEDDFMLNGGSPETDAAMNVQPFANRVRVAIAELKKQTPSQPSLG